VVAGSWLVMLAGTGLKEQLILEFSNPPQLVDQA